MRQLLQKGMLALSLLVLLASGAFAQGVTTASLQGNVTDPSGETLPGANVVAIHVPSGTRYGSVTNMDGRFVIPNVRVGGPYSVTITFVGFEDRTYEGITLSLGQNFTINAVLSDGLELEAVEISASKDAVMNSDRTGAATNLSNERINNLPTISRGINDFTRMTPQSNGTSFAGRDNRFNNYTIDGNIYNNNFGLGSDQFAGGNPLSLDAIEEVQINLAPFDVRQNGFTGGNVNAITRSGTNEFSGSVYYLTRNQDYQGSRIGDNDLSAQEFDSKIFGVRVGGPIIKNKVFFFASVESEQSTRPGQQNLAARPGLTGDNVTRVPASELDDIRNNLINLYDYDPGAYEGYGFGTDVLRLNFRVDFNLSDRSKLALRYNQYTSQDDSFINGSSTSGALPGGFGNRSSLNSMHFSNTNYTVDQLTQSVVAELTTRISNTATNSLNIGFTNFVQERGIPGGQNFPMIEVIEGGQYYTAMGNELFSIANQVKNRTFNITNNFTYFKGKHTYTAGLNLEYMEFENAFNRFFNGVYRYGSLEDFRSAVIDRNPATQPIGFIQGFAFGDDPSRPAVDETAFGQFGLYFQDEWQATERLKLTFGIRGDIQFYPITLQSNPAIEEFTFRDPRDFSPLNIDVAKLPSARPLWSPRIGFNWDVNGDRTLQLRGGTGIFTGRIPFVWISNQVNNNGVLRGFEVIQGDGFIDNPRPFNPDVNAYRPENPTPDAPSGDVAGTSPDFRFPQVWRTNIAVDKVFGGGWIGTLEGIFTQDINNVLPLNVNLPQPSGTFNGPDQRPYWETNRINEPFSQAIYLANTNQGLYGSLMAQVQRTWENGMYFMVAYTRSVARDQGLTGGSTAGSLWTNPVIFNRNAPEMGFTRFDQPNRIIGNIAKSFSYGQYFKTTLSIFYEGGEQGRFNYVTGGNMVGDFGTPLIYVPNNPSEINFLPITSGSGAEQVVRFTAEQQSQAFFNYIEQDDYLRNRRGQYVERFGPKLPWVHRFDFRLLQDITIDVGGKANTIQVSLDILNFGNMINNEWGVQRLVNQPQLLNYAGRNAAGEPQYRINLDRNNLPTETFRPNVNLSQVWQMQFGVRYIFN
ncbi:TonB-dependent receptor [Pararhodonellum marinum]|uniref:TonB-dependent receptor n=1 Tax=Pararhodonellum marinum TaxID=2755358 RepID=UPI00188F9939|nr:carboxypeptidase regulatory-like domain-containing protein [Pararhodonellum marinum]